MLANKHRTGGPGHMSGVTAPELCACARVDFRSRGRRAGGPRPAVAELFLSWGGRARGGMQCTTGEGFAPASGPSLIISRARTSDFQPVPGGVWDGSEPAWLETCGKNALARQGRVTERYSALMANHRSPAMTRRRWSSSLGLWVSTDSGRYYLLTAALC